MLYVAQVAVCSQINTKHISRVWAERTIVDVKLLMHHVTSRLWKVNPLNMKRRLLYLKTHFVPSSKHFSSRL